MFEHDTNKADRYLSYYQRLHARRRLQHAARERLPTDRSRPFPRYLYISQKSYRTSSPSATSSSQANDDNGYDSGSIIVSYRTAQSRQSDTSVTSSRLADNESAYESETTITRLQTDWDWEIRLRGRETPIRRARVERRDFSWRQAQIKSADEDEDSRVSEWDRERDREGDWRQSESRYRGYQNNGSYVPDYQQYSRHEGRRCRRC